MLLKNGTPPVAVSAGVRTYSKNEIKLTAKP